MIIPLEKLVEYKGNKYELARAMIELARTGKETLAREAKQKNGKYIQIAIKNIIDGKIKFGYTDETKSIDPEAPFLKSNLEYDENEFAPIEEEVEEEEVDDEDEDTEDDEDEDETENEIVAEEEAPKPVKKAAKKTTASATKKATKKKTAK